MAKQIKQLSGTLDSEVYRRYMDKLVSFTVEYCGLGSSKQVNRVDLKKALLNATYGRSLTKFVKTLSISDKKHLKMMCIMECPVVCPNKKTMLPPTESMPRNIMKSSKKLRNFFGIPEVQVCRGCIKRSRCRRYKQVERDIPDLSDLVSVMIGLYSTCKIHLEGSDHIVPEFSFRGLLSVIAVLDSLTRYFRTFSKNLEIPRGEDQACNRELRRIEKEKEVRKLELLKAKVFNIPENFNIMPSERSYMTGFQRNLYNILKKKNKKKKEEAADDYIWVPDIGDTTLQDTEKKGLERINRAHLQLDNKIMEKNPKIIPEKIENLKTSEVQFRMEYHTPIGEDVNVLRYDIMNDKFIHGIRINSKGRVVIDLESHFKGDEDHVFDMAEGVEMYKPVSAEKAVKFSALIKNVPLHSATLSFLKRVPYSYKCQSSGEVQKTREQSIKEDTETLTDIALAIDSN